MKPRAFAYALLAAGVAAAWSLEPRTPTEGRTLPPAQQPPAGPRTPPAVAVPLARPALEPALRDPFRAEPPPMMVAKAEAAPPAPPPPPPAPELAALPPAPAPVPSLGLSFLGRLHGADGLLLVLATDGSATWSLAPGLELPGGFRVEEVAPEAVHFSHPASGTTARLELPPAPSFELR